MHEVGVALDVGHEGSLVDAGSRVVVLLAAVVASPLACEDARAVLGVELAVVVAVHGILIPLDVAIVVLVDKVGFQLAHGLPAVAEMVILGIRAACADELYLGVSLAHLGGYDGEAVEIWRLPLLVADGQELEVERLGMPHVGTKLGPLVLGGVAVGKVDEVDAVVDELLQAFLSAGRVCFLAVLELADHAHVEHGQRLGANLLSQLEILEEAEAVALEIVGKIAVGEGIFPAVLVDGAVLDGAYGIFPLVAQVERSALNYAAAGEAEDTGMEVLEGLGYVFAQTVLMTFIGVNGEERDVLDIHDARAAAALLVTEEQAQLCAVDGAGTLDCHGVLFPFARVHLEVSVGELLLLGHRVLVNELNPKVLRTAVGHAGPDGETVVGVLLETNAEEALVLKAGPEVAVASRGEAGVVRVALERAVGLDLDLAEGVPPHKVIGSELEGAVLEELAVEAAVGREVDVLEEDAPLRGLNHGTGLLGVDGDDGLGLEGEGLP